MNISMTYPQLLRQECTVDGSIIKMSPIMTNVVERLLLRRGHLVEWDEVMSAAYPNPDDEPETAHDSVKVILTRHRVLRNVVETWWGRGFFLPR